MLLVIGFLTTLVFTTLKILDKIDWAWFWVLSPLIFSVVIAVVVGATVVRHIKKISDEL